jgi:spermidine/putrescine transport system permease protein
MVKKILARSFIIIMLFLMYLPILFLMVLSFTESKAFGVWTGFSFNLYVELFQNEAILQAVGNTVIIGLGAALIATIIGTISAVGIYSMKKVPKTLVNGVNQITILNADIVTASALLLLTATLSIPQGYGTLLLAHIVICTPYVVLSVMPKLSSLDPNLYEAALDLGATPTKALFKVMIPQLIPGMITGFVLALTLSMDDFIISNYTNGGVETISTFVYKDAARAGLTPSLRALSTIIFLVVLTVLLTINIYTNKKFRKSDREEVE